MPQLANISKSAVLSSAGGGEVDVYFKGAGVQVLRATLSASSSTNQPTADLYRNGVSQASRIDGTFTGAKDTAYNLGFFQASESLHCVWTGGDAGATVTLSLQVQQYDTGPAPPDSSSTSYIPFTNSVVGGYNLVRTQIQSPNYVPGSTGWIIRKDGTSEFASAVMRGELDVGPASPSPRGVWTSTIPAPLVNASADFTWTSVRLFYFDATQFEFEAIGLYVPGPNTPTYARGVYLTAVGVLFIEFNQAITPFFQVLFGSTTYNSAPLTWTYRNGTIDIASNCALALDAGAKHTYNTREYGRGIMAAPISTTTDSTGLGATEGEDTNLGNYAFTGELNREYQPYLANTFGVSGAVGDRYILRLRDGLASNPTNTSPIVSETMFVAQVANQPQPLPMLPPFSVINSGAHTLGLFVLRSGGVNTMTITSSAHYTNGTMGRSLYVADVGQST